MPRGLLHSALRRLNWFIALTTPSRATARAAWLASKEVGRVVEGDLKDLVRLRNEAARKLGFKHYHVMQLALGEQDQAQVLKLNGGLGTSMGLEKAKSLIFEQEVILEEKDLEGPMWALEMALMESDVAMPVAEEIVRAVKSDLVGKKKKIGADTGAIAEQSLRNALLSLLSKNHLDFDEYVRAKEKPVKILFVGVNGTGKTTSIAKVARYLMNQNYSVVLAAGDTFRAGAIEQLEVHGNALGIKVVKHKTGGDPAAVIFDAVEYAKAHNKDVVLADTAGRLHTNVNLMEQLKKISRVIKPDLVIMDVRMGGISGLETLRRIRQMARLRFHKALRQRRLGPQQFSRLIVFLAQQAGG